MLKLQASRDDLPVIQDCRGSDFIHRRRSPQSLDELIGDIRDDEMVGGLGSDRLYGGPGNDNLYDIYSDGNVNWPTNNLILGGDGTDSCSYWSWDIRDRAWEPNSFGTCENYNATTWTGSSY